MSRGLQIGFAHRSFRWSNEARGQASLDCVIIGIAVDWIGERRLFDYADPEGEPVEVAASAISPYLVDGHSVLVASRAAPICHVPELSYGSFALDDGNYTLDEIAAQELLSVEPAAAPLLRPFVGGQELLHGDRRSCLWLDGATPSELRKLPKVLERVEAVRRWREGSGRANTRKLASIPTRFAEIRQPGTRYVAIPTVASERRHYLPLAFLEPKVIASNQIYVLPSAGHYHFGVLHSSMHMSWVRHVCGRLESRFRYSAGIVYNNFPWPDAPADAAKAAIESAARGVLEARARFPDSSLADLYDPRTMPTALVKAHQVLDRAVDAAYVAGEAAAGRRKPLLNTDAERVAFLFTLYQHYTSLLPAPVARRKRVRKERSGSTPAGN